MACNQRVMGQEMSLRQLIQKHLCFLEEELDMFYLKDRFIEAEVFSDAEITSIPASDTRRRRSHQLLLMLLKKDEDALKAFLHVLLDANEYYVIQHLLEESKKTADSSEDKEADFNVEYSCMEQPPLIKQLKTILAEYPDDGQIIKELIQNAEDAGATQMKILYDGRRINSEVDKKVPYRDFFKGPALCFYNNANFSEDDWQGIKKMYSSVKEEDPLKVGRFGLGFKSVFHITDFPCIISGTRILLMNPHERALENVCITMELVELKKCKRLKNPFSGTFGFCEQTLDSGKYDGTFFWFPLREEMSELSDTVYDGPKVLDLFKSFQSEATNSLLFLKSLTKVELLCEDSQLDYDLPANHSFFTVEIHDDQSLVREERQKFLQNIRACGGSIPSSDIISVTQVCFRTYYTTHNSKHVKEKDSSWLVVNMLKGGQISEKLKTLVSKKDIPYVSVAAPLDGARENFKGHVFCFLPLPQENKSLTGLPVHVNGIFALSQNRRHLKWASADQEALNMHRDKSIEWNECLVAELLPKAYVKLMDELIYMSKSSEGSLEIVETLYSCIPDVNVIESNWEPLVRNLAPLLLKKDFVFLTSKKWLQPSQPLYTMFDQHKVSKDIQECVRKTLRGYTDVDSTAVPDHVWEFIKKYKEDMPRNISPNELSKILKSGDQFKQNLTKEDRIKIFEYLLSDKDFDLIEGLELLPLETGTFVKFKRLILGCPVVYMCSKEELELFPGLEEKFVLTSLQLHHIHLIKKIADKCQVQVLSTDDVVILLGQTIQHNFGRTECVKLQFSQKYTVPSTWIEQVWNYIFKHFPNDLKIIQHLPLLPSLVQGKWNDGSWRNGEIHLYKMTEQFVLKSAIGMSHLPEGVCSCLKHLSIHALPSVPAWIDPRQLECIYYPTQSSILHLLDNLQESDNASLVQAFNSECQDTDREALISFLEGCSISTKSSSWKFLRRLKLFPEKKASWNSVCSYVSLEYRNQHFDLSFPVRFPKPLLVFSSKSSRSLAQTLGVAKVNENSLVMEVLEAMGKNEMYDDGEMNTFLKWFLQNISKFKMNNNIILLAKSIPFVTNGTDVCSPTCLFDPRETTSSKILSWFLAPKTGLLESLFLGENKFPTGDFSSNSCLDALSVLGLKKKEDVSAADILDTARLLHNWCQSSQNNFGIFRKANALLQFLESKSEMLSSYLPSERCQLHSAINSLSCVPHKRERPSNYPSALLWKGSEFVLCSPKDLKSLSFASTVGSVLPLVEFSSKQLEDYFHWNDPPSATHLARQLRHITIAYTSANKPALLSFISDVYKAMSNRTEEVKSDIEFQELSSCVWWEDGFCPPQQIVLDTQTDDINLKPYMYHLPQEFQHLRQFFHEIGCHEKQDISVLHCVQDMILVRHRDRQIKDEVQVRKDLNLTVQILKKLYQEKDTLAEKADKILFPTYTEDDTVLILKPANQCTFCDAQWLRDDSDDDDDDEHVTYVHSEVPCHIAEGLGVKSLRQHMMSDAEGLEEWGQGEPLTRRLHNLLKQGYVDGLSVPKELIQNADDAGATEVRFLYDERENLDARTQLLDEGMAECQGPALWCYNSAVFTENDLKNITELSAGSKEADTTKIGKFGLGFCAVYNLTDVPSFLSGHEVVILDPHTTHLGRSLHRKIKGIRISLNKKNNRKIMTRLRNQFKPFEDVFGCNLTESQKDIHFNGTLFRFPLRTQNQSESKIKDTCYSREEMIMLLTQFVEAMGNMLLFTQNVSKIELYHLADTGCPPSDASLMCRVNKEITGARLDKTMLELCSDLKKQGQLENNVLKVIQRIEMSVEYKDAAVFLKCKDPQSKKSSWIVSWASGTAKSLELMYSTSIKGALPLGAVAVLVEADEGKLLPVSIDAAPFSFYKEGHIFCYLPLPVTISMDMHINGSFAVKSDRRSLSISTEDDKCADDTIWNDGLLGDAIVNALTLLLETLPNNNLSEKYNHFNFWPAHLDALWLALEQNFYEAVVDQDPKVFENQGKWFGLSSSILLDRDLLHNETVGALAQTTLTVFNPKPGQTVTYVPDVHFRELQKTRHWSDKSCIISTEEFLVEVFLPRVQHDFWVADDERKAGRNRLLLFCLNLQNETVNKKMATTCCIPTQPHGVLLEPSELVHTFGGVSVLFRTEDGRFPDSTFSDNSVLAKLSNLGMMNKSLALDLIHERALSIKKLAEERKFKDAMERCRNYLKYLSSSKEIPDEIIHQLKSVPFLPVFEKPFYWHFTWKLDSHELKDDSFYSESHVMDCKNLERKSDTVLFEAPDQLYRLSCMELVSCTKLIIDERSLESVVYNPVYIRYRSLPDISGVFSMVGVNDLKQVNIETVIQQLCSIAAQTEQKEISDSYEQDELDRALAKIYGFINTFLEESESDKANLKYLEKKSILHIGTVFVQPLKVFFSLRHNCSPEIFGVKDTKIEKYPSFLKAVGVRDEIAVSEIVQILKSKKEQFGDQVLPDCEFHLMCNLLLCLCDMMKTTGMTFQSLMELGKENIVAPDINKILRPTCQLCFDDCDFIETTEEMLFVHEDVSRATAEKVGVLTKRMLDQMQDSDEIDFEQNEELVTRLNGLLSGYPCDVGVMKELIQNADDAGATEIHFVYDMTTYKCDRIFDQTFEQFQGPSILVFNNSSFSKQDLKGIQDLGKGTKAEDPTKTGQYGVGFNAVYNFTDLPSFLTKGPDVENGETLCLFDPLHKFLKTKKGIRFRNVSVKRKSYPDVFEAYHEKELFLGESGTIFRFPLRACPSEISPHVLTAEKVEEIFSVLKEELFEMLLFLKNVTKISVSSIAEGQFSEMSCVEIYLNDENKRKRDDFFQQLHTVLLRFKENRSSILTIQPVQQEFEVTLKNNAGKKEVWYVVHRLGFEEINEKVRKACDNRLLGHLPIGGVAVAIDRDVQTNRKILGKAYCFLPLPGETGLPVHINGHFALDHEARRTLWKEDIGYRSEWNNLLLSDVIVKAYTSALKYLKYNLFDRFGTDLFSKQEIQSKLEVFNSVFPICSHAQDQNWTLLAKKFYMYVESSKQEVFPAYHTRNFEKEAKEGEVLYKQSGHQEKKKQEPTPLQIKWWAYKQEGDSFAVHFFENPSDGSNQRTFNRMVTVLQKVGMKLICSPSSIKMSIEEAGIRTCTLSPDSTIKYLKSHASTVQDKCNLGNLPCVLEDSQFGDLEDAMLIVNYCKDSKTFFNNLEHLPLLITNDQILRMFSIRDPVFCTRYHCIAPNHKHRFLHRSMVYIFANNQAKHTRVFKNFGLQEFVNILSDTFPGNKLKNKAALSWDAQSEELPNKHWIQKVWSFIWHDFNASVPAECIKQPNVFKTYVTQLSDWCLFPAWKSFPEFQHILIQIDLPHTMLDCSKFCGSPLAEAVARLKLPSLDCTYMPDEAYSVICELVAKPSDPVSVLECLHYYRNEPFNGLTLYDRISILGYFADNLACLKNNADHPLLIERLKTLPLFVSYEETGVRIDRDVEKVLVLPRDVPINGIPEWACSMGMTILKKVDKLHSLYDFIGLQIVDGYEIYLKFIFRSWNQLPDTSVEEHLQYIRDQLLSKSQGTEYTENQRTLIEALKCIPCVLYDGSRKRASQYYSPQNSVFKKMFLGQLLPAEFCTKEWHPFFTLIGLKTEVDGDMIISFAQQVSQEGKKSITFDVKEKSEVLVKCFLSKCDEWKHYVFERISRIDFIVPYTVAKRYIDLFPQPDDNKKLICFAGSVSHEYSLLCWSTVPVLPFETNPGQYRLHLHRSEVESLLEKLQSPPLDKVISHCQNFCDVLKLRLKMWQKEGKSIPPWIVSLFEEIYAHLLKHGMGNSQMKRLYHTPLVYLLEERQLVPAHQTVKDMQEEEEIHPYLFRAPSYFGKYFDLFVSIGAAPKTYSVLYVKVLKMLKDEVGRKELIPSDWAVIRASLKCLFKYIELEMHRHDEELSKETLYLPSRQKKLVNSTRLVLADGIDYELRLGPNVNIDYIIEFQALEMDVRDPVEILQYLPKTIRPKKLSDLVEEVVVTSDIEIIESPLANKLQDFIHSNEFIQGIIRLVKHEKAVSKQPFCVHEEKEMALQLRTVSVSQTTGLKTYLHLQGERISNTMRECNGFVRAPNPEEGMNHWCIYFQPKTVHEWAWITAVAKYFVHFVRKVCKDVLITDIILLIPSLFRLYEMAREIGCYLNGCGIVSYHLSPEIATSIFEKPGTYVPKNLHAFLNCDFSSFHFSEYYSVALEIDDPMLMDDEDTDAIEEAATFIFVWIRKKLEPNSESVPTQKYLVNIGAEEVIMPGFKLYKFIRPTVAEGANMVATGNIPRPSESRSLSQVFYTIRHILTEAWKLPEQDRRCIIKRLYLQWHPDKNIGNEEFCTKVFRYIKEVIWKLEQGISLEEDGLDSASRQSRAYPDYTSSSYFRFCERMDRRSRSHTEARAQFYSSGSDTYSSSSFHHTSYSEQPYSDVRQANRWQRQAKIDLRTAVQTLDLPGDPQAYNWACYQAHQAAEKSLKAACYVKNANDVPGTSHHISSIAIGLHGGLADLARRLDGVVGEHTRMRYPDRVDRSQIPSTAYTREQAASSIDLARQIVDAVSEQFLK